MGKETAAMVYNSKWNKEEPVALLMGAGVYPLKSCNNGPAPQADLDEDIVDEALDKFKANVMFRNFKPQGPADLTHLYLLLFIHQCLGRYHCPSTRTLSATQWVTCCSFQEC